MPGSGAFRVAALANGWTVGVFGALEVVGSVVHAVTTRRGFDVDLAGEDRRASADKMAGALDLDGVAFSHQVHGSEVVHVDRGGPAGDADGLTTDVRRVGLMGLSADCPLILAADTAGRAVGMAHASWRGTVKRIASELIVALGRYHDVGAGDVVACICPSAGPCCYQVGQDVVDAARKGMGARAEAFFAEREGRLYFDLWSANRDELIGAGVRPERIHLAEVCTICRNDLFPSYRVEGTRAGRFAAVIARG